MTSRPCPFHPLPLAAGLVALALLGGCDRPAEAPAASAPPAAQPASATPGEKLDDAIARTQEAARKARDIAASTAADVRAEAGPTAARAGEALKEAGADAQAALKTAGSAIGRQVDDASLTAAVSAQLAKDPELSALRIDVDTKGGVVTLNGPAPSEAAKARAGQAAKAVAGVTGVDNRLQVRPS